MCGRYSLAKTAELKSRYGLKEIPKDLHANLNVAPSLTMPVIVDDDGVNLDLMRWGIPRFIGEGKMKDVFNTRADKAFASWKKLTMTQRLLIPATGFYEWKDTGSGKQRYFIRPKGIEIFSFAGVWNTWENKETKELIHGYSIITTEPNKEMSDVHNRMPVILHQEDESTWISPSNDNDRNTIEALLRPFEDNGLELYKDDRDLKVARGNDEYLVYPLNSQ